jgi:chromosome segregation ATPase
LNLSVSAPAHPTAACGNPIATTRTRISRELPSRQTTQTLHLCALAVGMEAISEVPKRILEDIDEAKSPHRILVRSLLKSRNRLRAKYRELRTESKRWRNQAAAVERSRSQWRQRAKANQATAREERVARETIAVELQEVRAQAEQQAIELAELHAQLAAREGVEAEKKGPEPA